MKPTQALCAAAVIAALSTIPTHAAQRAFVASTGSDANTATSCSPTTPCRSFTAAHSVVDPGGEIIALDAAGYGAVTITKSVTIAANPGVFAGIAASSGNAVTIATPGVNVILRGLNLNAVGPSEGVNMTAGSSLSVENCVISNFNNGVVVLDTAARVRILDTIVRGNSIGIILANGPIATIVGVRAIANTQHGIQIVGATGGTATVATISDSVASDNGLGGILMQASDVTAVVRVAVTRSVASYNSAGIAAAPSTGSMVLVLNGNTVTQNVVASPFVGVFAGGGTTVETTGNNTVRQNGIDVSGTVTPVPAI